MPNLDTKKLKEQLGYIEQLAKQKKVSAEYEEYLGFVKTLISQFNVYGKDDKEKGIMAPEFTQEVKEGLLNTVGVVIEKTNEMLKKEASSSIDINLDAEGILIDTTEEHLNSIKEMLTEDGRYLGGIKPTPGEALPDYQRFDSAKAMQHSFEMMLKQIKDVDPMYVKSSKDFKSAKAGLESLIKYTKSLTRPVSEEAYKNMLEKAQDVADMTELYIAGKTVNPGKSNLAESRLSTMKNVFSAMKNNIQAMHNTMGSNIPTNGQMAQGMLADAKKKIELNRKDLKLDSLKDALAIEKYANQLSKIKPNAIFNRHMAQRAMEQIKKSPDFLVDFKQKSDAMKEEIFKNNAIGTLESYEHYCDDKALFGAENIHPENDRLKDEYTSIGKNAPLSMSFTRSAYNMMVFCHMIKQGNSVQDIFDPNKLQKEKVQAGKDILDFYKTEDPQTLANVTADYIIDGLKTMNNEISKATSKMTSFEPYEFCKPENRFMIAGFTFLQDLGQEIDHPMIKEAAEKLIGKKVLDDLTNKQSGVGIVLKSIGKGPIQAAMMQKGYSLNLSKKKIDNGETKNANGFIKDDSLAMIESYAMSKLVEEHKINGKLDIFASFSLPRTAVLDPQNAYNKVSMMHANVALMQPKIVGVLRACADKNWKGSMQVLSDQFFGGKLIGMENIGKILPDSVEINMPSDFNNLPNQIPEKEVVKENVL